MGNTQDNIQVSWSYVRAAGWRVTLLLLAFALLSCRIGFAQAATTQMAMKLRQNTVRISASPSDGGAAEDGFGFITGERGGFLYIATAKHVLVKDSPDAQMPSKVSVTLFTNQGETLYAEALSTVEGDLAVLKLKKPAGFEWVKDCLAGPESETFTTQVSFVGRGQKWYVPPTPGAISSDHVSFKWEIEIEGLNIMSGTSGAPLISDKGIVGMIRTNAAGQSNALVIEQIERAFKDWQHPWDLTRSQVSVASSSSEPAKRSPSQGSTSTASAAGPTTRSLTQSSISVKGIPAETSTPLSVQVVVKASATETAKKGTYDFNIWLEGPKQVLDQITSVEYRFEDPSFKNPVKRSSDEDSGFKVDYRGWGCMSSVPVIITPKSDTAIGGKTDFSMCHALGWK